MVFLTFKKLFVLFIFTLLHFSLGAQNMVLAKKKVSITYPSNSDLIIIKAKLNGLDNLNFIVDTGTNGVIVFDRSYFSVMQLNSAKSIFMRGLGSDTILSAKEIKGNYLKLNRNFYSDSVKVYLIEQNYYNLGAKFGIDIHGILGNDIFRNFVLQLDYSQNRMVISKEVQKIKNYDCTDLDLINNKPFINIEDSSGNHYELLMDTGGVDALWLFESEVKWHEVPHIRDFLGFGLSGEVIGNRIGKDSIYFQKNLMEKIYLAVPDTIYTEYIKKIYPTRDGSVGAQFLKRFNWIIDYKNEKIYYKTNSNFRKKFTYNATGMEVYQPISALKFFIIESVLKGSAADLAGLYPEDVIVSINNTEVSKLELQDIYKILNNFGAKKMTITVKRDGQRIFTEIPIRDILNGE